MPPPRLSAPGVSADNVSTYGDHSMYTSALFNIVVLPTREQARRDGYLPYELEKESPFPYRRASSWSF